MTGKYRAVFNTPIGQEVLSDILSMCHFGATLDPDNKVEVSEYNVGVAILARLGIFSKASMSDVVRVMCSIPIEE